MALISTVIFLGVLGMVHTQRTQTEDTWTITGKDTYTFTYRLNVEPYPRVTWWYKAMTPGAQYQILRNRTGKIDISDRFLGMISDVLADYELRLVVKNISDIDIGYYKVVVNSREDLTRNFSIQEMPVIKPSDVIIKTDAPSTEDLVAFSKNQIYLAAGLAGGIVSVMAFVVIILIARIKMKTGNQPSNRRDADAESNISISGGPMSSHHYTDIHSMTGYEGLDSKRDSHDYLTTTNTAANRETYLEPTIQHPTTSKHATDKKKQKQTTMVNALYGEGDKTFLKSPLKPGGLLVVPQSRSKNVQKKENRVRRFSDSTSDREDSSCGAYENVNPKIKKNNQPSNSNYVNVNELKRTRSAQ